MGDPSQLEFRTLAIVRQSSLVDGGTKNFFPKITHNRKVPASEWTGYANGTCVKRITSVSIFGICVVQRMNFTCRPASGHGHFSRVTSNCGAIISPNGNGSCTRNGNCDTGTEGSGPNFRVLVRPSTSPATPLSIATLKIVLKNARPSI